MNFTIPRIRARNRFACVSLAAVLAAFAFAMLRWFPASASPDYVSREVNPSRARLSDHVSIRPIGRTDPRVSLRNGHDLLTSYLGPEHLQRALTENQAQPRSLASADFDEDGVPDLVSGYAYNGRGIITVHRGNVDSIYPNTPEAKQRKADGTFTTAPFLSPGKAFDVPVAADFVAAGDFDADGHFDLAAAARGSRVLVLLAGDGRGGFALPRESSLPGVVTAFVAGEINRADGLTDIAVGVTGEKDSRVLVFEGSEGALRAEPEVLKMTSPISSLALGQFDDSYEIDLAIATGRDLVLLLGRDRKLSLDEATRRSAKPPNVQRRLFDSSIESIAVGDFVGDEASDLALLCEDGAVRLLSPERRGADSKAKETSGIWRGEVRQVGEFAARRGGAASQLVAAYASGSPLDDLLIVERDRGRLRLFGSEVSAQRRLLGADGAALYESAASLSSSMTEQASFTTDGGPVAVLPMRLDPDALSDLVILRQGSAAPAISLTHSPVAAPSAPARSVAAVKAERAPLQMSVDVCTRTPITIGQTVNGELAAGDCKFTDGTYLDPYSFTGQAGQYVSATVTSTVYDTYVDLLAPDNTLIAFDGFNEPKRTSQIIFGLPEGGVYDVRASSFLPNTTGPYTLTLALVTSSSNTFVVTNTNDSGAGSLRQAILDANASRGPDTVLFEIGTGPKTITPASQLPDITDAITLDATTQPGFAGQPIIELSNGGFNIKAGRSVVRGFVINKYEIYHAITLERAGASIVEGNYLGTDITGSVDQTGEENLEIISSNNTIGGTAAPARNVISGAFFIGGASIFPSTGNRILGNYIGLNAAGAAPLNTDSAGFVGYGLVIESLNNFVGGTTAGARNVISGNSILGLWLVPVGNGTNSGGNLVQGNYVGTDATGTKPVMRSNVSGGISVAGDSNTIGGTSPTARNVVSGNGFGVASSTAGISVYGSDSELGNLIQGNYIGTDATGTKALGNTGDGVQITIRGSVGAEHIVGGAVPGAANVIAGNGQRGVAIGVRQTPTEGQTFTGGTGIIVRGNYIGTDATGVAVLGNVSHGVFVDADSFTNTVADNVIAKNGQSGIFIPQNANPGVRIFIDNNLVHSNAALGIDLGAPGITVNDPLDTDGGANLQQNFPVLTSAVAAAGETVWERAGEVGREMPDPIPAAALTINGTLNSTPNATFTVHWYFSGDAQCITNQAATRPLLTGKVPNVMTNGNGDAQFSFPFDFPSGVTGGVINCTATDAQGNTSEFSSCMQVGSAAPTPTPTPTPSPGPMIFIETGTNNVAAVDSVGLVRGPFMLTNTANFSSDQRTRIIFFTTNLGLPKTFQPPTNTLAVQVGGASYPVESVGPNATTGGSQIVFRLPDLSPGTYPLGIRLNGVNSANTPNLTIIASTSSSAVTFKSNKARLAEYLLFPLLDLIF